MANQKIKKSSTLMGTVLTILVVITFFSVMFFWLSTNSEQSGVAIDSRYNESYNRIVEQQNKLNETVTDIQGTLDQVQEADNALQVAWNGMKFVGTTVLETVPLVGVATGTMSALTDVAASTGISPTIVSIAVIGLVAFMIFLVIANLKGEPKMVD